MGDAGRRAVLPLVGSPEGREGQGCGAGGDRTLKIDRAAEEAIRGVLETHAPAAFTLISEECGVLAVPGARWWMLLDPLDGSLNAKRGLEPFSMSVALAVHESDVRSLGDPESEVDGHARPPAGESRGLTLADVSLGYVEDYPRRRVFSAMRGAGLHGFKPVALDASSPLVEIALLEAGRPDRHHFEFAELSLLGAVGRSRDMRVRQIGSLALALCYVATGIADVLFAPVRARAVDVAAGLLILAESGGGAAGLDGSDLWAQPLDLERRTPFVAWRKGIDASGLLKRARQLYADLGPEYSCA